MNFRHRGFSKCKKCTVPLRPHRPTSPQVVVTTKAAKRYLYSMAGSDTASRGAFGWTGALMLPIRGADRYVPFLTQMARLIARIGSADVPEVWGTILTCGGLFALHKEDPLEQMERSIRGLPPRLRPVNVGCCLLKWALKLALKTEEPQAAIAEMQPHASTSRERPPDTEHGLHQWI